mgnify:CR=1 FL=1
MKLKEGFITQDFRGQQLMVAAGPAAKLFHGLVRSNETAAFIVDRLKTETTKAGIVRALLAEYEVDEQTAAADVAGIIERLRGIGAIEE